MLKEGSHSVHFAFFAFTFIGEHETDCPDIEPQRGSSAQNQN